MEIHQGDVYWIEQDEPKGSEPGYCRPFLIIQNNLFNKSKINTVVVCALTTNLQRAKSPGNVLLDSGEGGLLQTCVINVSQIFTVDKTSLEEYSGSLSQKRIAQVVNGISLIIQPADID
jgi:mRNA interferase MazF